jgi:ribosomal protein S18 acetylase RimI-like enzyme
MIDLLAETFARHDPPAVVLGITQDDFKAYLSIICANAGDDGLSIVARDVESGIMAGALRTEDAARSAQIDLASLSPRFEPIFDLFGELEAKVDDVDPIESGTTLHVFMLGVDERFSRRGIAQRLVEVALANGAAMGYGTAVTEATNLVSQHIFEKLGFSARAQASYADYRRDGIATFASIANHRGIISMARKPLER